MGVPGNGGPSNNASVANDDDDLATWGSTATGGSNMAANPDADAEVDLHESAHAQDMQDGGDQSEQGDDDRASVHSEEGDQPLQDEGEGDVVIIYR